MDHRQPGQRDTDSLFIDVTVNPGTAGSTITNTATITSSLIDPDTTNNADSVSIDVIVPSADVSVDVSASATTVLESDSVSFTVAVANAGPDSALGVVITDLLPGGLTYTTHAATSGSYDDVTGAWTLGGMDTGTADTLRIDATVDPGTGGSTLTNIAAVTGALRSDPVAGNNVDSVSIDVTVPSADVSVDVSASATAVLESDSVTFTVAVANAGPDSALGVVITDLLPGGLTYRTHAATSRFL